MATYNGEKYLAEQVESILQQLGENDELVVSDDCSTDNTIKILENFNDKRIKIFHNEKNNKLSSFQMVTKNFENALKNASGDYIFLSDQDDVWLPNKVEVMLHLLQEDCLAISDSWLVNDKLEKLYKSSKFKPYVKGFLSNFGRTKNLGCAFAFTKKIKDYVLPFPKGLVSHDIWIHALSELKFKTVYTEEPLFYYRRHTSNLSDVQKSKNSLFFMIKYRAMIFFESIRRYFSGNKCL
jgi:glycosyltransferase involved in cell wall biosynthesis